MATHELADWETPTRPAKKPFFSNLSLPSSTNFKSLFRKNNPPNAFDAETKGTDETAPRIEGADVPRPRRTFFGQSRKKLIIVVAFFLAIIILIVGLAVGLKKKSSSKPKNLPLPSNTNTFTGDLTYYSPGPGYGACGYENTATDAICAVSHIIWDAASTSSNPNNNPLCGKKIRITRYDASRGGNSSVDVEVVDRCVGCVATDLDLSLKMFTSLADESLGRVVGSWAWLN